MSKKFKNFITIFCFASILLIPLGIVLMWFQTQWKKFVKIILTIIPSLLYLVLIAFLFFLEPSYNTSGTSLPFSYNKGYTAFENENTSSKKSSKKSDATQKKESQIDLDSIIDTPPKQSSLPKAFSKNSGGKTGNYLLVFAFFILIIVLIIIRNLRSTTYENPYVDTALYKLPLKDDAKLPVVHFLRLQTKQDERILFATETCQKANEGNFIVTNQRVVIFNKEENVEFPLEVLEAVSSVSDSVMLLTSGSRKYYIFMHESQLPYALAVVRWAYKNNT